MKTKPWVFVVSVVAVGVIAAYVSSESQLELEGEISRLGLEIERQREELTPLVEPWISENDVEIKISVQVFSQILQGLNSLTEAERTVTSSVVGAYGQLWRKSAGLYVEFDPGRPVHDYFVARLILSGLDVSWLNGLHLRTHAVVNARIGMLKWNAGALSGHAGPADCTAVADLNATLNLSMIQPNEVRYVARFSAVDLGSGCTVSCGSAGNLQFGNVVPATAELNLAGSLGIPILSEGEFLLGYPEIDSSLTYKLRLDNPQVAVTAAGIQASSNVSVEWR